ncbi:MAG TPA: OmpA family protein [Burkholderiales bacterium]|nr:OmpA family protein [Burkholderiales bacterium]
MLVVALAALVAIGAIFAQPAPLEETVVVLPSPDGHTGTVIVQRGGERHVLNEPYATSRVTGGQSEIVRLSDAEVKQSFGVTLDALPARPTAFLLYFVTATDELTDESKDELKKVLDELKHRPVPDILVVGHTDTVGELDANDRLSAQRAERVKGFLVEIGIPARQIQTAGRGERELLIQTADNIDEPRNRRVEINVR